MKSKIVSTAFAALLSMSLFGMMGTLNAGEAAGKGCMGSGMKMEGKGCSKEMCARMEKHHADVQAAIEKMGEHLDAMKEIRDEKEWRAEVEKHMGMLQLLAEEMANCPMEKMMHMGARGENGQEHPSGDQ